ncbi:MAG: aryl-sulfate sulfotransferase [Alphaproteobacteria bacterium]
MPPIGVKASRGTSPPVATSPVETACAPVGVAASGARRALAAALLALLVASSPCGAAGPDAARAAKAPGVGVATGGPPVAASPVVVPPALSPEEVARLKALGYVDVADEPAGAGTGVVRLDRSKVQDGYTLFTNAFTCSARIIDVDGRVVHQWSRKPCFRWDNTTLLPDGDLLVVGRDQPDETRKGGRAARWEQGQHLARLAWDGTVRWERRIHAHHDAEPVPDGRISVLVGEDRRIPEVDPSDDVVTDKLVILSPAGEVVEEAQLYDMLRDAPGFVVQQRPKKGEANSDLLHANAIDWMRRPELAARDPLFAIGNVLVCMRHQDAVAIVDWRAQKVVWHWGQGEISGPHDAQVLPNGNILLFDNGVSRKWSRVIELDPVAKKIAWEWKAPDPKSFFSLTRGSNHRLANGNTLIADSDSGRGIEVTPDGEVAWEFVNPAEHEGKRVAIVRMRRLPRELVDRLLAGGAAPGSAAPAPACAPAADGAESVAPSRAATAPSETARAATGKAAAPAPAR